ncbi:RusA family crossover junction endodeoxyribonuclease [Pseudoalteromonas sp. BZK2]|uniref:RusA family crossover junction endodeoxyribonuclease n=1 Tax=Pseudoalteromonas sp. BZK2 TaxID=1904458 RepID=UPI0016543DC3|nr:RusA family crossover junction endodeoxyribonuclease [Pseudoalteromonas sp. BZK2]MBC7008122.1 RusA family crossover junction endodeoxyribonuclease [Pseudoalteromonas sp. BZK2]
MDNKEQDETVRSLLQCEHPDLAKLKQSIMSLSGLTFIDSNAPTSEEIRVFGKWLAFNFPNELSGLRFKFSRTGLKKFYVTISDKLNTLYQYHCSICDTNDSSILFPKRSICIRINPESYQSLNGNLKKEFHTAMKSKWSDQGILFEKDDEICVLLVFVYGKNAKNKDVDNMAKIFIDSLKGVLIHDDINIVHLNILKRRSQKEDGYILARIQKTKINQDSDVLFKSEDHGFGGQEMIDIRGATES